MGRPRLTIVMMISVMTRYGSGLNQKDGTPAMEATETKVPLSAGWLGGLGAAPFVCLAGAIPFLGGAPRLFAAHALVAYGATILSFLGGVHWAWRSDRGAILPTAGWASG